METRFPNLPPLDARAYRAARQDRGDGKVQALLEAAGQVFAEKGPDRATGKEIAERAGINPAAVNYYFGGIENLYTAVLVKAHDELLSYETLSGATAAETTPEAKLRAFFTVIADRVTGPNSTSWKLKVLSREFLAPSPAMQLLQNEFPRKASIIRAIVSDLMGLPEDHPLVAHGCVSVIAPNILLVIGDRPTLKIAFPYLRLEPEDAPVLVDRMTRYALAGLKALAEEAKS
ncbi:CerR family C-terminal domain-containing protein [Methyloligella sp. 2.7D]|uniref:CerR family C-terminal domain-containing protein n=1 Tax=unclassified Methyloligella TaxID=2625955 RepID=UPI00157DA9A6|nr:CerR family C-terminal domain-containing protein [Methyloligella sp. GL2]QKP78426.1 CerR family C-terminal domain-containing protein [Methyloligella sp. GL2]